MTLPAVYGTLGVRPVVNALGNVTPLGGSLMHPDVLDAMTGAARCFVDVHDLLERAGERIAAVAGVEAAFVTSGASAAVAIATAACMTGTDPARIAHLPETDGMPNEVIVHRCQRTVWDQAVRLAGARIVEIGVARETKLWELEEAIGERTAAILYLPAHNESAALPLRDVIAVAGDREVPVIVDAAAELPPVDNLRRFVDLGADLAIFSGGKMIGGPQSSGLILGRRSLIAACAANASPNFAIGRSMKVGREEIVGLVWAVELFVARDFVAESTRWEAQVRDVLKALHDRPGIMARRVFPGEDGVMPAEVPRAHARFDERVVGIHVATVQRALRAGEPSIAVGVFRDELTINPITLCEGEEHIVATRIIETLEHARPA
jgi:L-seryl-tRNA(Ser) seleniumtransferase